MEGKAVILTVFIMSLTMAQIQLGAAMLCCPSANARTSYNICSQFGTFMQIQCATLYGCQVFYDNKCPPGFPNDNLENSGDAANEYCKLGCASSVCTAITTLQNSDASETVNGAVEQCTKACASLCSKGSTTTLKTA